MCGSQLFVCTMFAHLKTQWPNCVIAAACLPSGHRQYGANRHKQASLLGWIDFFNPFLKWCYTLSQFLKTVCLELLCSKKANLVPTVNSKYHKYCSSKSKKLYLKSKVFQQKEFFLNIFAHLFFLNYEYCTCTKFLKIKNLLLYKKITIIHI